MENRIKNLTRRKNLNSNQTEKSLQNLKKDSQLYKEKPQKSIEYNYNNSEINGYSRKEYTGYNDNQPSPYSVNVINTSSVKEETEQQQKKLEDVFRQEDGKKAEKLNDRNSKLKMFLKQMKKEKQNYHIFPSDNKNTSKNNNYVSSLKFINFKFTQKCKLKKMSYFFIYFLFLFMG